MLEEDFAWLLARMGRASDSQVGQVMRRVFVGGELPAMACRAIGMQISKFSPTYDQARRMVSAMRVTEADGFTAAEVVACNRALALSRRRETPFVPSAAQWAALGRMDKAPLLTLPVDHDLFPALCRLVAPGYVTFGGVLVTRASFTITDAGREALRSRFNPTT